VDDDLWQRVQAVLRRNRMSGCPEIRNKYGALLKGILFCVPCRTGMGHSYTKRSGKIYRYYVCLNAQQQCWATCPTKSVNANDIETAVIQHIRGIGRNEELIAAIAAKIREKGNSRLSDLETEQRIGARELERLNARVQKLVGESFAPGATKSLAIDHLADLQDRIRAMEKRMAAIGEEILAIQRQALRSADLEDALEEFDPVWEALSPREKAQILHLLIERIGYNGRDGKVTVTFRSPEVKALCSGTETKQAGLPN
jgi:site-specific DNA recombinase